MFARVHLDMCRESARVTFRVNALFLVVAVFVAPAAAAGNPLLTGEAAPARPAAEHARGFATEPVAQTFSARRAAFIDHLARTEAHGPDHALAWLAAGKRPPDVAFADSFGRMNRRVDCADFQLQRVLRLLYQFGESPQVSPEVRAAARRAVLDFKYWPDEPGIDSMCTWSENHYILFAGGAYLAGQLYPDTVFTNTGETGREKMARFRPRVAKWLELRFKTGFSEWLSHVYYDENIAALTNLVDFCEDETIATRAAMVLDLLLADMACNSYRGIFGSSHGRSYERHKKWPARESTSPAAHLLFGLGSRRASISATALALSPRYRMPRVLYEIAHDTEATVANRQRMGIRLEDAGRWGIAPVDFEAGMHLLTLEAYAHPRTINLFVDMLDAFNWWENEFFEPFHSYERLLRFGRRTQVLLPLLGYAFKHDLTRNVRSEVNVYTYRTPDYQLSTAQDWRPGMGGDQQHIWQATLGPTAVAFTTHPARRRGLSPNYWTGNGTNPRAAQVENVVVCLYDIHTRPGLYVSNELRMTHAWLPVDGFDEVVEQPPWIFARQGDGYLALYTHRPWTWQVDPRVGEDFGRELIVPGQRNAWICELGRRADDGDFDAFMARIAGARVTVDLETLRVMYDSPSRGRVAFCWEGPLTLNDTPVPLGDYPRYDNPYAYVPFPAARAEFDHAGHWLRVDWHAGTREASAWVE